MDLWKFSQQKCLFLYHPGNKNLAIISFQRPLPLLVNAVCSAFYRQQTRNPSIWHGHKWILLPTSAEKPNWHHREAAMPSTSVRMIKLASTKTSGWKS